VRKLSLGQRMKAEIAASLLHKPRLLLLDEPTIGIDVVARQRLRELICQWNREEGLTVFLTSHDTGDIESVASRVVVINHGQVVLDSSVENFAVNVKPNLLLTEDDDLDEFNLEQAIAHLFQQAALPINGMSG
jgi:ABC-type uncharacterized transport system ATPase subunit